MTNEYSIESVSNERALTSKEVIDLLNRVLEASGNNENVKNEISNFYIKKAKDLEKTLKNGDCYLSFDLDLDETTLLHQLFCQQVNPDDIEIPDEISLKRPTAVKEFKGFFRDAKGYSKNNETINVSLTNLEKAENLKQKYSIDPAEVGIDPAEYKHFCSYIPTKRIEDLISFVATESPGPKPINLRLDWISDISKMFNIDVESIKTPGSNLTIHDLQSKLQNYEPEIS